MADNFLALVHLSDIHYGSMGTEEHFDLDSHVRNELVRDLTTMKAQADIGKMDAILITGDIVYSGQEQQFSKMAEWLKKLCGYLDCSEERVWTTPGNHDVNREILKNSPMAELLRRSLRDCKLEELDKKLRECLKDSVGTNLIFAPLKGYIDFSSQYHCETSDKKIYWEQKLDLNEGFTLSIRGLNSVLVSNGEDSDQQEGTKLILGEVQMAHHRADKQVLMTLCHHPTPWLKDGKKAEEMLNALTQIQLYGHEHSQQLKVTNDSLILTAGAVHPERSEDTFRPFYNVILLKIEKKERDFQLHVRVYAREWDRSIQRFKPHSDAGGRLYHEFYLPLKSVVQEVPAEKFSAVKNPVAQEKEDQSEAVLLEEDPDRYRKLIYKFLTLPYPDRISIGNNLGLWSDTMIGLNSGDFAGIILKGAENNGVIDEFEKLVFEAHSIENKRRD